MLAHLDVVSRSSKTQLQVGEKLNKIKCQFIWVLSDLLDVHPNRKLHPNSLELDQMYYFIFSDIFTLEVLITSVVVLILLCSPSNKTI